MKSKILIVSSLAAVAFLAAGSLVHAETSASASASTTASTTVKADGKLKVQLGGNLEKNKEIRNIKKENQKEVKEIRKDGKEEIKDLKESWKNSSTTKESKEIFKGIRKTIEKKMKRDVFEVRKDALVQQLTVSFNILTSTRTRINDFIAARQSSTTTSLIAEAKAALVIADQKLAQAKISLDALATFRYATTTASTTASTTMDVDLEKPRKIGDDAIKALKDARDALKEVVKVLNRGKNN